jgi:drug/metabolite transporter (DMT)-like permease
MQKYALIFATLFLTVAGQLIIRARAVAVSAGVTPDDRLAYLVAMFTDVLVWVGLGCAVLAAVCWTLVLQQATIAVAYPFQALSFVLAPLGALILFGEAVTPGQFAGMALIVAGVTLSAVSQG